MINQENNQQPNWVVIVCCCPKHFTGHFTLLIWFRKLFSKYCTGKNLYDQILTNIKKCITIPSPALFRYRSNSGLKPCPDSPEAVFVLQVEHQAVSTQVHFVLGLRHLQVKHTNRHRDSERRANTGGKFLSMPAGLSCCCWAQWEHCQGFNTELIHSTARAAEARSPSIQETHATSRAPGPDDVTVI